MRWLLIVFLGIIGCATEVELSVYFLDFQDRIPDKFSCKGEDVSPGLGISGIPDGTRSLALVADDPDARLWVHWVAWNIPVSEKIAEGSSAGVQGVNDFGKIGYGGPCPPFGIHSYHFKVYSLDEMLDLPEGATKAELLSAMDGHILAKGEVMGIYTK